MLKTDFSQHSDDLLSSGIEREHPLLTRVLDFIERLSIWFFQVCSWDTHQHTVPFTISWIITTLQFLHFISNAYIPFHWHSAVARVVLQICDFVTEIPVSSNDLVSYAIASILLVCLYILVAFTGVTHHFFKWVVPVWFMRHILMWLPVFYLPLMIPQIKMVIGCAAYSSGSYTIHPFMSSLVCWHGNHVLYSILAILNGLLFLYLSYTTISFFYDTDIPTKHQRNENPVSSRTTNRPEAFLLIAKTVLVLLYIAGHSSSWRLATSAMLFLSGGWYLFQQLQMLPWWETYAQALYILQALIIMWTGVVSFVMTLLGDAEGSGMLYFIMIPVLAVAANLLVNWRYNTISRMQDSDVTSPLKAQLLIRGLIRSFFVYLAQFGDIYIEDTELILGFRGDLTQRIEQVMMSALTRFPESVELRVFVAFFYTSITYNRVLCYRQLQATTTLQPTYDMRFRIHFVRDLLNEATRRTQSSEVAHYLEFKARREAASECTLEATRHLIRFWTELLDPAPDIDVISIIGHSARMALNRTIAHYDRLLELNPNSVLILRMVGTLHMEITGLVHRAAYLFERADQLENAKKTSLMTINYGEFLNILPNVKLDIFDEDTNGIIAVSLSEDNIGVIESVNHSLLKMLGYSHHSDLVGKSMNMLIPDPIAQHHNRYLMDYLVSKRSSVVNHVRMVMAMHALGHLCAFTMFVRWSDESLGKMIAVLQPVVDSFEIAAIFNERTQALVSATPNLHSFFGFSRRDVLGHVVTLGVHVVPDLTASSVDVVESAKEQLYSKAGHKYTCSHAVTQQTFSVHAWAQRMAAYEDQYIFFRCIVTQVARTDDYDDILTCEDMDMSADDTAADIAAANPPDSEDIGSCNSALLRLSGGKDELTPLHLSYTARPGELTPSSRSQGSGAPSRRPDPQDNRMTAQVGPLDSSHSQDSFASITLPLNRVSSDTVGGSRGPLPVPDLSAAATLTSDHPISAASPSAHASMSLSPSLPARRITPRDALLLIPPSVPELVPLSLPKMRAQSPEAEPQVLFPMSPHAAVTGTPPKPKTETEKAGKATAPSAASTTSLVRNRRAARGHRRLIRAIENDNQHTVRRLRWLNVFSLAMIIIVLAINITAYLLADKYFDRTSVLVSNIYRSTRRSGLLYDTMLYLRAFKFASSNPNELLVDVYYDPTLHAAKTRAEVVDFAFKRFDMSVSAFAEMSQVVDSTPSQVAALYELRSRDVYDFEVLRGNKAQTAKMGMRVAAAYFSALARDSAFSTFGLFEDMSFFFTIANGFAKLPPLLLQNTQYIVQELDHHTHDFEVILIALFAVSLSTVLLVSLCCVRPIIMSVEASKTRVLVIFQSVPYSVRKALRRKAYHVYTLHRPDSRDDKLVRTLKDEDEREVVATSAASEFTVATSKHSDMSGLSNQYAQMFRRYQATRNTDAVSMSLDGGFLGTSTTAHSATTRSTSAAMAVHSAKIMVPKGPPGTPVHASMRTQELQSGRSPNAGPKAVAGLEAPLTDVTQHVSGSALGPLEEEDEEGLTAEDRRKMRIQSRRSLYTRRTLLILMLKYIAFMALISVLFGIAIWQTDSFIREIYQRTRVMFVASQRAPNLQLATFYAQLQLFYNYNTLLAAPTAGINPFLRAGNFYLGAVGAIRTVRDAHHASMFGNLMDLDRHEVSDSEYKLLFRSVCDLDFDEAYAFVPSLPPHVRANCDTYAGGIMSQGLYNALSQALENLNELVLNKYRSVLQFITDRVNPDYTLTPPTLIQETLTKFNAVNTLVNDYIVHLLKISTAYAHRAIQLRIVDYLDTMLVLTIIFSLLLALSYVILFHPTTISLANASSQTKSMMLLLPPQLLLHAAEYIAENISND